ncbi:chloramphenicol phosphotransferase CPT family protein [Bacillus oleronius]|nr:chloramphenicol phosphotransferase CPT family protein [Heyndrickxia oleronia]
MFVGVHYPLYELELMDKLSGDRLIGQAKKQLEFIHQQKEVYDIQIDTYKNSIKSSNDLIVRTCLEQTI